MHARALHLPGRDYSGALPGNRPLARVRSGVVRKEAEGQLERFTPGFKDTVLARQVTLGAERVGCRLYSKRRQSVPCGHGALLTSVNLLQGQSAKRGCHPVGSAPHSLGGKRMRFRTVMLWTWLGVMAGVAGLSCGVPATSSDSAAPGRKADRQPPFEVAATAQGTAGEEQAADISPEAGGTANPNNQALPLMYFEDYGVNPFIDADEDALSTFALDGDTASYAVGRRYLRDGWLPPPESVRIEEYVNAFEGGFAGAAHGLSLHLDAAPAPFALEGYVLLRVGVAASAFPDEREPVTLIFIVDVSGSMGADNRLEAAKRIMLGLLDQAHPADKAALVIYSDQAVVLEPLTNMEDPVDLKRDIRQLHTSGPPMPKQDCGWLTSWQQMKC